jgi:hypothetical protein
MFTPVSFSGPVTTPELRKCYAPTVFNAMSYQILIFVEHHSSLVRFCFFLSRFAFNFPFFVFLAAIVLAFFDIFCGVELPEAATESEFSSFRLFSSSIAAAGAASSTSASGD